MCRTGASPAVSFGRGRFAVRETVELGLSVRFRNSDWVGPTLQAQGRCLLALLLDAAGLPAPGRSAASARGAGATGQR